MRSMNPESRDSPGCNCTPEVWSFRPSRNDGVNVMRPSALKYQSISRKLRRQTSRNRRSDRFGREEQVVAMPAESELVVGDVVGIGIRQIAGPQQKHPGKSEVAEELKNLRGLRVVDAAFELHDRPKTLQQLFAAMKHAAFVPLDVALDEPDIAEQVAWKRIKARHRHVDGVLPGTMTRG